MQSLLFSLSALPSRASASVFDDVQGLVLGVDIAKKINGPLQISLRDFLLIILYKALNFLALAAVVMLIAAGIYLVMSGGNDAVRDRVKKMVLYVVIGLVIVFFARLLVGFLLLGLS